MHWVTNVSSSKCLGWHISPVDIVMGGKCLGWKMSWVANVLKGKCLEWQMSWVANASGGKCLGWQVVRMANVSGENCFIQRRVAPILGAIGYEGKIYMWQKFQWQKCLWQYWWVAIVLVSSCMWGQMPCWHVSGGICLHTLKLDLYFNSGSYANNDKSTCRKSVSRRGKKHNDKLRESSQSNESFCICHLCHFGSWKFLEGRRQCKKSQVWQSLRAFCRGFEETLWWKPTNFGSCQKRGLGGKI